MPNLDPAKIHELINLLLDTRNRGGRVIINAAGRIGEVAVFFQQKLRALGFIVDDFKEITPEFLIGPDDLVLTLSGSGLTASVVDNMKSVEVLHESGKLSRRIFSITATPSVQTWKMGEAYHTVMGIKGRSKVETKPTAAEGDEYLPLSTTFEASTMLFLEGIIEALSMGDVARMDGAGHAAVVRDVVESTPRWIRGDTTTKLKEAEKVTAEFIDLLMSAVGRAETGIVSRKRVYLFGLGQNNYVIRLFARRAQNIGYEVYVPGPRDIVSKSRPGDIAIFVSNSGARGIMQRKIETAKAEGCRTVVITADPNSDIAKTADIAIPISSRTTTAHTVDIMRDDEQSRAARGIKRMFELAAMFYLEGVSVTLMRQLGIDSGHLQHVAKAWE